MDAGFYRGTNSEQDGRFSDKEKKLLKQMKFEACLDNKVDLQRVNIDIVKPWITQKLNLLLGLDDDVVTEYVFTQLEEKNLNPKIMQINLTGFLNARRAREFMGELWQLLLEAQSSKDGIPTSLIDKKMKELKASSSAGGREVPMAKATETDWKARYQALTGGRYGKTGPNYASEPGAADDLNQEPESPSNRRWKREPTPDYLPIPRRKRGDEGDSTDRLERDRDAHRPPKRRHRSRSRSGSRERHRRRRSPSPSERRFTEARPSRRSPSYDKDRSPPPRSHEKERKRHDSGSDRERKKHKKHKKEKKHKKDRD